MNRQKTRPYVPLFLYTAVTTMIVAMVCSILAVCVGGKVFCLHTDCLLGYISPQVRFKDTLNHPHRPPPPPTPHPITNPLIQFNQHTLQWITKALPYSAVGVALFMCFNYSLQYFSPLLFSAITLVDPACTGFVSWFFGIEGIPDKYTWVSENMLL